MNDVLDRLATLRSPDAPVDADTVAADVRRGRRALHRRRAVRGGVLAACALAVAGVAGTTLRDPSPAVQQREALRLVTYTGEQVPGFTVDKVPEGFVLQGATASNLNVTRPGDTSSIDSFVGKIVVMLEQADADAPAPPPDDCGGTVERKGDTIVLRHNDGTVETPRRIGDMWEVPRLQCAAGPEDAQKSSPAVEPFDVDGDAATITTNEEGTKTLRYAHGDYTLAIQVWPTLKLTDAQLVEFADGVSVTGEARPGLG